MQAASIQWQLIKEPPKHLAAALSSRKEVRPYVSESVKRTRLQAKLPLKELAAFFFPLAITSLLIVTTHSLFNAGLARLPSPEVMIAAFAVAKSLTNLFQSPLMMIRQTVSALVDHRKNLRRTTVFLVLLIAGIGFILVTIAFSGISRFLFRSVMGLSGQTLDEAVRIMKVLCIFPLMVAIRDYFSGFAIKFRFTPLITLSSVLRILYVFILILTIEKLTMIPPAYLAGLMFLGAVAIEAMVMFIGTRIMAPSIPKALDALDRPDSVPEPRRLTYQTIILFYIPLFITKLIHTLVMPLINGGLARTPEPDLAISVFAVAWNLGMILLSPFMMFHQVPLNYIDEEQTGYARSIRKFAFLVAALSASGLALLAFTPLGYFLLTSVIGASHEVSVLSADVLKLMCLLPFLMVIREYYWGICMSCRMTRHIGKGKTVNLLSLIAVMTLMILINPANPAIIGVIGYIGGECGEFIYLYTNFKKRRRIAI